MRSFQKLVIIALGLTASSAALAHSPPSLVQQQRAAETATRSAPGYRDITWRFGSVSSASTNSAGYRDLNWRFAVIGAQHMQMASASRTPKRWR